MRIVILGPPGSGKGSQARRVAVHYQLPYITVQGALSDIAAEDSELGRLVRETMEANRVSDELMLAVLRVRLGQGDVAKGFVLDGFPRTGGQSDTLDLMLDGLGRPVDVVMLIDVDPDDLMERLVGRLTCEGCGTIYNLYTNPPTVDGVCDRCGGRVSRRPDDYEETNRRCDAADRDRDGARLGGCGASAGDRGRPARQPAQARRAAESTGPRAARRSHRPGEARRAQGRPQGPGARGRQAGRKAGRTRRSRGEAGRTSCRKEAGGQGA